MVVVLVAHKAEQPSPGRYRWKLSKKATASLIPPPAKIATRKPVAERERERERESVQALILSLLWQFPIIFYPFVLCLPINSEPRNQITNHLQLVLVLVVALLLLLRRYRRIKATTLGLFTQQLATISSPFPRFESALLRLSACRSRRRRPPWASSARQRRSTSRPPMSTSAPAATSSTSAPMSKVCSLVASYQFCAEFLREF